VFWIAELFIFDVPSEGWRLSMLALIGALCLNSIQAAQKTGLWPIAQNLPVG
jgi:hypothetical protein